MILFLLSFLPGFITTYLVMRKKHFKVLQCCLSIREYPLNSSQKMEQETSNSQSSNYPQTWESSMQIPEHSRAANFAANKRSIFLLLQFL